MSKLLLIDGYSILNRAFYGLPMLSNSKGVPTNAVYGFLNILFRLTDMEQPDYAAVAFDLKAPTFRHKMYDAYKGTRKPMPEELHAQVPVIREILTAMGIKTVACEGYEADDILGTLAKKGEAAGMDVMILSGDRDILQLVTDKTTQRLPKTVKGTTTIENYTPEKIKEVYGIEPRQIVDLKAMMGDSSDNIPGLPGVGEKTASNLLAAYGSLENAHDHYEEIKPKKAMEAFRDHYDLGLLSKELATIITDVPLKESMDELRLENMFTDEAFELFKEYEFRNLYPRFEAADGGKTPEIDIEYIEDPFTAEMFFSNLCSLKSAGMTADIDSGALKGLAVSDGKKITYIRAGITDMADGVRRAAEAGTMLAFCDLKDQLGFLPLKKEDKVFDVIIAAYLMNPLKSDYPYEVIAKEFADVVLPSAEEIVKGKITRSTQLTDEQREKTACYKAHTACVAAENMRLALETQGMLKLFEEIEMPLVFTLHDIEKEGIEINRDELASYGAELAVQIEKLEEEIYEEAGERFNINSPKQLGTILFEKLGLKGGKKTKSGYSTAADVLEKLAGEAPVVEKILNYRQLTKLKSTYADSLGEYCDENGRIHSHFMQTVTATGRLSSVDPNLQNIPVRAELGREIRKVFVPKKGCVFVDADYSQIELRVMAHFSGDEKLIAAYRQAQDIHALTASQVFGVPIDEVTPLQRRSAKAVNFGIIYGISSFGLGKGLNISNKEAKAYIEKYFETYPGIRTFLDTTVEKAKADGYTTTLYGRRRPIPELASGNFMQRSFGERAAMNSPIQGTAADIIKIAMNRVHDALEESGLKARIVLQVHDELLIEAPEEEKDKAAKILKAEMTAAAELLVPLETDVGTGYNWNDAH